VALVLLLFATHWSGSVADTDAILREPIAAERVVRGILVGVAAIIAVTVVAQHRPALFSRRLPMMTFLGLYVLINGVSTIYSVAPIVTAAKAFELFTGFLIILGIGALETPVPAIKRSITLLIALEGVLMAVSVIGFFALPGVFSTFEARRGFLTERTLTGIFMSPNALSVVGAIVAVFALARLLKIPRVGQRAVHWSGLVLGLTAVVLASGRQGLIILVLSIAIVQLTLRPFQAVFWALPAATLGVALYASELAAAFTRGQQFQLLISLSGRTEWWGAAISAWLEHPWLGYGFAAGGRYVALEQIGFGQVTSLHSGYLEVLTGVGIFGLIPLMVVLFGVGRFCLRVIRVETEYAILLLPLVLHTFISLGFGGWLNTDFLLLGLLAGLADTWSPAEQAFNYFEDAPARSRTASQRRYSST
jgi:O-antigen ligase